MPMEINADAYGIAALTVLTGLVNKLIDKKIVSKEEMLGIYKTSAAAKISKGMIHDSGAEAEAATLIAFLATNLESRS